MDSTGRFGRSGPGSIPGSPASVPSASGASKRERAEADPGGYAAALMRTPLAAVAALLAAAVAVGLAVAAPASAAGDFIMPLSQVHSGMRCTGYSVVRGTDISSFDVEVLDVVDGDPSEDGPRILVQVSGPAVDSTGIGPGFSGSPIYCRDESGTQRNIGAISESIGEYGGKVVLATPIEAILSNKVDAPKPRRARASASIRAHAAHAERLMRREGVRDLTGPLTVSGLSPALGRALEAAGRHVGRPVLAAPAGPLGDFPVQTLRPGSAVAVGYSSGDLRLGAIGTVAYTDDGAVWAFGHPFEGGGARSLLLQDAYVFHVVNDPNPDDAQGSYKLSAPGHDVGTLTNDALDAVVGRVGALPRTIPIRVRAHDDDTGRANAIHVRAADESAVGTPTGFSPLGQVAPLAVLQAGSVLGAAPGRLSGRLCLTVRFREPHARAHFCNRYVSAQSDDPEAAGNPVASAAAFDAVNALALIDGYEGRPPHVQRVDATLHMARGELAADLRAVHAPRTVHPGQRIRLRVALRHVQDGRSTRTVHVRLPRGLRPGHRMLTLTGDRGTDALDQLLELLLGGGGSTSGPATLPELVAAIDATGGYDGVVGKLAGRRFRVFRDPHELITGQASTPVRVVRR
jgi:hypothetical protein